MEVLTNSENFIRIAQKICPCGPKFCKMYTFGVQYATATPIGVKFGVDESTYDRPIVADRPMHQFVAPRITRSFT